MNTTFIFIQINKKLHLSRVATWHGLVGLMTNPSPIQIKKQSTRVQLNPNSNLRYSIQSYFSKFGLSLSCSS